MKCFNELAHALSSESANFKRIFVKAAPGHENLDSMTSPKLGDCSAFFTNEQHSFAHFDRSKARVCSVIICTSAGSSVWLCCYLHKRSYENLWKWKPVHVREIFSCEAFESFCQRLMAFGLMKTKISNKHIVLTEVTSAWDSNLIRSCAEREYLSLWPSHKLLVPPRCCPHKLFINARPEEASYTCMKYALGIMFKAFRRSRRWI